MDQTTFIAAIQHMEHLDEMLRTQLIAVAPYLPEKERSSAVDNLSAIDERIRSLKKEQQDLLKNGEELVQRVKHEFLPQFRKLEEESVEAEDFRKADAALSRAKQV